MSSALMRDEIFGPILPIRTYRAIDDAIAYVNTHDRPLALYPFSGDRATVERILECTLPGGVSVNDTLLHFGVHGLPFGGIGPSGMGAIHGHAGFSTFSKLLPVFRQSQFAASDWTDFDGLASAAKWIREIDGDDPIEACLIGVEDRAERTDRRIVDDGIDAAKAHDRPLDHLGDVRRQRDVGFHQFRGKAALREFLAEPGDRMLRRAGDLWRFQPERHDKVAALRQAERNRPADAKGAAADEDDFSRNAHSAACRSPAGVPNNSVQSPPFM